MTDMDRPQNFLARARLTQLLKRFPEQPIRALFVFVNGSLTIAILAGVAMVSGTPFVFPSLGPTAFLFFVTPTVTAASPRNTIYGHAIGILCGFGALVITGLQSAPAATVAGVGFDRVLAAALSLASMGALMVLCKSPHPPAGATTLIISLGIVTRPFDLVIIQVAVVLLTVQAIVINRLAGIDYPLWASRKSAS